MKRQAAGNDDLSVPRSILPEPPADESPLARYGFAVVVSAIACGVRFGLDRLWGHELLALISFCAVLAAGLRGGTGPGIVATILVGVAELFIDSMPGDLRITLPVVRLTAEGLLVSLMGGQLREIRRQSRATLAAYQRLEKQVLEISDDERRRIGHDLHDGLGQHLTGISLLSESMAQQMHVGGPLRADDVETITSLVSQAVSWTRDLARGLSPVTLENEGLIPALEELASTASSLFNVHCEWDYDGPEIHMDLQKSLHIYRITQEAISNSVKHGKAKRIDIGLLVDGDRGRLTVVDDGSGLSQKTMANPGLGLRIMQYRARMAAADVTVKRATPSGGTIVMCVFVIGTPA